MSMSRASISVFEIGLNALAALDTPGYQGYVGLEYNPTTSSEASLAWLPEDRSGMLAVSDLRL